MKKQKGITLIALIITIIVMLILVGVTINVALDGGLIGKTQNAAKDTQKAAEKEQLLAAVLATIGTNGEVDLKKVVLPDEFTEVSDGVYKSTKSGTTYKVDKETLNIDEGTGDSGNTDNALIGVYYDIGMDNAGISMELKSNNEVTSTGEGKEYQGTYTYDENSKSGQITLKYETEVKLSFSYITITDESGNEINSMLEFTQNFDGDYIITQYAKQKTIGLIPLDGYVYENGTTTIEFSNVTIGSETYGRYAIKENGATTTNGEGDYAYYNGKLIFGNHEVAISADFSTITINETVYTKKN